MKHSFPGLIGFIGAWLLRFIYGSSYKRRWYSDSYSNAPKVEALLSLATVLWLFTVIYLLFGHIEPGTLHCVIYAIGYPITLAAWYALVRLRAK